MSVFLGEDHSSDFFHEEIGIYIMKVIHIVGTRPNFVKIGPIMRQMERYPSDFEQILVHTGQHYDYRMSGELFEDLELLQPNINLGVGSGSHAQQTAQIITRFEPVANKYKPDLVIVVGDVNSTLSCALVSCKMNIKVAHVEAGLRSFDRTMPEELNRILTDQISDLLFTPSVDANQNLIREGIIEEKIHLVGNVMIDTLINFLPKTHEKWYSRKQEMKLQENKFVLATLHRPSNVDDERTLSEIMNALVDISRETTVVFPVHPRTRQKLKVIGNLNPVKGQFHLIDPLGYLDFLALEKNAGLVITDSGGVQEETTYLSIPCLTVRPNTERPITITSGTNRLVESKKEAILAAAQDSLKGKDVGNKTMPPLWDGEASKRIVHILRKLV